MNFLLGREPRFKIVLALDADKREKVFVQQAEENLVRDLTAAGYPLCIAEWDASEGKGLDDLLTAGGTPTLQPVKPSRPKKTVEAVSADWLRAWDAKHWQAPAACTDLSTVREQIRRAALDMATRRKAGTLVLKAPPGAGKTITVLLTLQDALRAGTVRGRVLILLDTLDQIAELLRDERLQEIARVAAVRYGRSKDEGPGYCADKTASNVSGALEGRRQRAKALYCTSTDTDARCPFSIACSMMGYLANLERCEAAPIVFAAKANMAVSKTELDGYGLIIVDEDLSTQLFEQVAIDRHDIDEWDAARAGMEDMLAHTPKNEFRHDGALEQWLRVLRSLLVNRLPTDGTTPAFLPAFRQAAEVVGVDADRLLKKIDAIPKLATSCERVEFLQGTRKIPLRASEDLVAAVLEDVQHEGRDSRVTLCSTGIRLSVPRRQQLEVLRQKRLLNLDATPCTPKLRILFPKFRLVEVALPVYYLATQITDRLLAADHIGDLLERINRVLDAVTRGERSPVIFGPKRFNPANTRAAGRFSVSNPAARFGHFGGSSRGTNAFEDASLIIIVGHHSINVGEADHQLRTLRAAFGTRQPVVVGEHAEKALVPYSFRHPDGSGLARWVTRSTDPDVAAFVDWSRTANVLQTIGRGRPSADARKTDPLRVLILTAHPLPEVPVHALTTLQAIEEQIGVTAGSKRGEHLQAGNVEKREELDARVRAEAERLSQAGERLTDSAVARAVYGHDRGRVRERIAPIMAAWRKQRDCGGHPTYTQHDSALGDS